MRTMSLQGWERFQHYKDRSPPWIKLHRELLTSEAWVLGSDHSRLLQVASMLLAARYSNRIPLRYDLIKKVCSLEMTEKQFKEAIEYLVQAHFLEIQEVTESRKELVQDASTLLAKCSSEERRGEESREEKRRGEKNTVGQEPDDAIGRIFAHWRDIHGHPKATLDLKRRRVIREALKSYSEADLCQSIGGYKNSPHHMGQNERATVYDDIELFLRDSKHIEAGLRFARDGSAPALSSLTRRNVDATSEWVPPEMRNAAN